MTASDVGRPPEAEVADVARGDAGAPAPEGEAQAPSVETEQPAVDAEANEAREARRVRWGLWALLVVVLLPIAVAAVRVAASDWVPVGDSALIAIRSQDVLDGKVPLLGMWASTSWTAGLDMNHPGPLLFDALAVPVAVLGNADGSAVGMALIAAVSVAALFVVCRRRSGDVAAALSLAIAALLCWSLGSAVLVEPWHATSVLLPFLLLCALAWSVADGDLLCLPVAVAVGSFIVQTNLSYAVLVPTVLLWSVVAYAVARRRSGEAGVGAGRRERSVRWAVVTSVVVVAVCWAQPLWEQVAGEGRGNLGRLWEGVRKPQGTLDWPTALRAVAEVVAVPPWWLRPSYREAFTFGAFGNPLVALVPAILGVAAVAAILAWCVRDARRRDDRTSATAAGTAAVVLAAAFLSANQAPTSQAGVVAYQTRYLWPVGAFVTLAVAVALARRAPAGARATRWALLSAGVVAVVASVANLPASHQSTTAPRATGAVASDVVERLAAADLPDEVRVECWEGVFDPYCEAVMAGLADDGVDFVQPSGQPLRQLGAQRRWSGDPAVPALYVMSGELAGFGPEGSEQVLMHEPLPEDEMDELRLLRVGIGEALASGELRLNDRGARLAREEGLPSVDGDGRDVEDVDPGEALEYREDLFGTYRRDIDVMVGEGLLEADGEWAARLDRYADLQQRVDDETVAVYLATGPSVPFPTD